MVPNPKLNALLANNDLARGSHRSYPALGRLGFERKIRSAGWRRIVQTVSFARPEFAMPEPEHLTTSSSASQGAIADRSDPRWTAVSNRDRELDGEFVYAVRTTGVYCRPSCPSRAAKRENVVFFETTQQARAAGYRACKRCTPDAASLEHRRNDAVTAACRAIEQSANELRLADLAASAGLSPHHFQRVFKQITGVTPKAYSMAVQARRLKNSLSRVPKVTDAIYEAGFHSSGRFYESAPGNLGMSPGTYRSGGIGEHVRHAVEPCALGFIIVAATRTGVCAIEFGDCADQLLASLRERFPGARFEADDPDFRMWVGTVLSYIEQPSGLLDLPLDIRGTVFQRRVWQALREIPCGSTSTYAQVAASIGQPNAARAVAKACASNHLAVAVPCHRVVRSDGRLSGYRWGSERKSELLKREAGA